MRQVRQVLQTLTNAYHSLLVSRRGAYSVERVLAFHDYCAQTSTLRALLVCFAFPLPSLLAILLMEAIPLQDPSLGLKDNYSFLLRVVITTVVVLVSFLQLALQGTPEIVSTFGTKVRIVAISMVCFLSFIVAISSLWRFPTPFMFTVGAPVCCITFLATWVGFVGMEPLKRVPKLKERAVAFSGLLAAYALLCLLYPINNAVFIFLDSSPSAQNVCVLVLPLMRLVMRNLAAKACAYWEDMMPETTIFSVEVFHSIYIALSMQSGNSVVVTAAVIAFDLGSSLFTLRRLRQRVLHIKRNFCLGNLDPSASGQHPGLLEPLVQAFRDHATLRFTNIRVLGSFPHNITPTAHRAELLKRVADSTNSTDRFISSQPMPRSSFHSTSVVPRSPPTRAERQEKDEAWVEQSLRLLFQCEYVLLAEYVESIVSAVCVVYLAVIFELPNLQYYPYQASIAVDRRSRILLRLAGFAAIEWASLVFVAVQMQRQIGVSTVHLLAFVLETQFHAAQGKLALWVIVVFQFPLVHFGADFPSLLRWMRGGS